MLKLFCLQCATQRKLKLNKSIKEDMNGLLENNANVEEECLQEEEKLLGIQASESVILTRLGEF